MGKDSVSGSQFSVVKNVVTDPVVATFSSLDPKQVTEDLVASGALRHVKRWIRKVLIPDSGATHSITCRKEYYIPGTFTTDCPKMRFRVVANDTVVESKGRGNVSVPMRDLFGKVHNVIFYDAYLCP